MNSLCPCECLFFQQNKISLISRAFIDSEGYRKNNFVCLVKTSSELVTQYLDLGLFVELVVNRGYSDRGL